MMKNKHIFYSIICVLILLVGFLFYPSKIEVRMENCSISTPRVKLLIKIDGKQVLVRQLDTASVRYEFAELSLPKKILYSDYLLEVSTIDNKFLFKKNIHIDFIQTAVDISYCGKTYFADSLQTEIKFAKQDTIYARVHYYTNTVIFSPLMDFSLFGVPPNIFWNTSSQ